MIQRLAKEVRQLALAPPEGGVTFVPNDEDETLMEVLADVRGPEGTPYQGGTFRLKLCISSSYPHAPPRAFFLTRIFHPNVGPGGDVCVNTLKRDWAPEVTLAHTLQVIRCLLICPFAESALNDEAGRLFLASYDLYARRARLFTQVHAAKHGGVGVGVGATETAEMGSGKAAAYAGGDGGGGVGGKGQEGAEEEEEDEESAADVSEGSYAAAAAAAAAARPPGKRDGGGGSSDAASSSSSRAPPASGAAAMSKAKGQESSRRRSLKRL